MMEFFLGALIGLLLGFCVALLVIETSIVDSEYPEDEDWK